MLASFPGFRIWIGKIGTDTMIEQDHQRFRQIVKGRKQVTAIRDRYSGIRHVGPESLKHFKRTYREALKRQIMLGMYNPTNPRIIPIKGDKRFRSWKEVLAPQSNACIVYMMDVSGS